MFVFLPIQNAWLWSNYIVNIPPITVKENYESNQRSNFLPSYSSTAHSLKSITKTPTKQN